MSEKEKQKQMQDFLNRKRKADLKKTEVRGDLPSGMGIRETCSESVNFYWKETERSGKESGRNKEGERAVRESKKGAAVRRETSEGPGRVDRPSRLLKAEEPVDEQGISEEDDRVDASTGEEKRASVRVRW